MSKPANGPDYKFHVDSMIKFLDTHQVLSQTKQAMGRSQALINRALELSTDHGMTYAWVLAEKEFSHVAPQARQLAFKIFSRLVVK